MQGVDPSHETAAALFRATLDLVETGIALMRQNLRRADPMASEVEIEERLTRWLRERPGAEAGDSAGRAVPVADRFP
jgi:hypothetical protein